MMRLAVSGCDEAALRAVAARLRGAVLAADPEQCDAVALIDPPVPEDAPVERFLSAGKHVLVTAQPWLVEELLERWSAAASGGTRLAVVNPDRYLPSRRLVREQLGKLGAPGLLRIHRWEPGAAGPLVRDLDLAGWLFGTAPNVVHAVGQGDGGVLVHLGFPGGGMALIDHAVLPPGDGHRALSLIGATGAAYADDHQNVQLVYRGGHPQAVRTDEGVQALAALLQEFIDRPADGTAWRGVLAVSAAVGRSRATRQAVHLEAR
jgi:predicted dehydrogenase